MLMRTVLTVLATVIALGSAASMSDANAGHWRSKHAWRTFHHHHHHVSHKHRWARSYWARSYWTRSHWARSYWARSYLARPYWARPYWARRFVVGSTVVAAGYPIYRTVVRRCLTKVYLPTGQVMFRDVCTKEWAMNPPPAIETQTEAPPEAQK
jgi:hypothetical protein